MLHRRSFLALAATAASAPAEQPAAPASVFADPDFGFTAQIALGFSYYRGGDPGKLLAILPQIKAGDFESAYQAYRTAAADARKLAEEAAAQRHRVSAREAYLWAAGYTSAALRFLDGTKDPDRALPCWQGYAECWAGAAALFDPPVERVEIPYEGSHLTGWFLRVDKSRRRRPLAILNTGADGLEISSYVRGAAGGLSRGYNCLILNGPGQGDSLWARKLYFRPDWEKVITPVVDAMLRHREVDRKRIALVGVSQGGYWVPRALAYEHRIAAGVADPGVWDVADPWLHNLPKFARDMLDSGKKSQFDQVIQMGTANNARARMMLRFRMRPYGVTSCYEAFHAVREYNLAEVAGRIRCPMLITDPQGEQFFPGQAQKLYDALQCPKAIVHFTREQGADQHCEVAAPGYRDYRIYNWLDETLA
ncbi:MAG TPA: prolyl oligopeptidase family serine peptidase [Bryobacteraceae bacterium]|nr:prolyl oligopeptidase family serine peptidase [Bryobacteraceae bacterium]